jgi:AAA domain
VSATPTEGLTQTLNVSELGRRWGIYTPGELRQKCKELDCGASLVAGLIPARSLGIVVGDSGVGKSPLLYQAAICVSAGVPFLGRVVTPGPVLYLDFENGLGDVDDMIDRLSRHVGLAAAPENLRLWNYNCAPSLWTPDAVATMVQDARPVWTIIDSVGAYAPEVEDKASNVTRVYQELRKIIRDCFTTITVVHHLKKPSVKLDEAPPPLQENPKRWLLQARGSRALINSCDLRIGVDLFGRAQHSESVGGKTHEVALVMAGFGRVRGNIMPTYLARVLDEDGAALGYELMSGASLLFNDEQQKAYHRLPGAFRFKDARMIYGRGAQATLDFIQKCMSVSIVRKDGKRYRKLEVAEQADS